MQDEAVSEHHAGSPPPGVRGNADLSISVAPVNRFQTASPEPAGDPRFGAVIDFIGVVRGEEAGEPILGIDYLAYLPMAERELRRIAEEGVRKFVEHRLVVHHVVGFVEAGRASLLVRVSARHSPDAFEACRWYLNEIKRTLPVWKQPVYPGAAPPDQSAEPLQCSGVKH